MTWSRIKLTWRITLRYVPSPWFHASCGLMIFRCNEWMTSSMMFEFPCKIRVVVQIRDESWDLGTQSCWKFNCCHFSLLGILFLRHSCGSSGLVDHMVVGHRWHVKMIVKQPNVLEDHRLSKFALERGNKRPCCRSFAQQSPYAVQERGSSGASTSGRPCKSTQLLIRLYEHHMQCSP